MREVPVAGLQLTELRLLGDPEDSQSEKAHGVGHDVRQQLGKRPREVPLAGDSGCGRNDQPQDEQGHADRKDPVADPGQPVEAVAGDHVVELSRPGF